MQLSYINCISTVDSTNVLCPLFDKIEILIPGDICTFSHLWAKCGNLIHYRYEENDFIEAVHQT